MAQNEVSSDFRIFTYIIAMNFGQLWEIFDVLGGLQPAETQKTCLEAVANYLGAILKVSDETRGTKQS